MKKIYLDANVLLEILFHRARYDKVVDLLDTMRDVQFCVSVLSIDLVMYFVEIEKQSKDKAWEFLSNYQTLDMTIDDAEWAHDNDRGDFEDALQVSCARRNDCVVMITLDQGLGKMYGNFLTVQTIR
jgi:predicted nucleic acid-binding protein